MSYFAKRPRQSDPADNDDDDSSSSSSRSSPRHSIDNDDLASGNNLDDSVGPLGTPRLHRDRDRDKNREMDRDSIEGPEHLEDLDTNHNSKEEEEDGADQKEQTPPAAKSAGILGLLRALTARPPSGETNPKDATLHHHHSLSMSGFKTQIPVDIEELESNYRILPLAIGCIIPVRPLLLQVTLG
jgi:hypothetical protein